MTDAETIAALQADNKKLADDLGKLTTERDTLRTQSSSLTTERDTIRKEVEALTPMKARVTELEGTVTSLTNEKHEGAFYAKLRPELPGADDLPLRAVVDKLHTDGKINRFAPDAAGEAKKALDLIKAEAPALARPPTRGGGSQDAPQGNVTGKTRHPI